ncbi:MAG: hypothetical protein IJP61_00290 [Treponema sp.]|nr:hypothetical protein [Treponema sp.]
MTKKEREFEVVDIKEFFDETTIEDKTPSGIVVFTENQQRLVDLLRRNLSEKNPEQLEIVNEKIANLRDLASAIATFPSLLERANLTFGTRTPLSLMDSLINTKRDGDMTLQLPAKATLGKGFLVTKLHIFAKFERLAREIKLEDKVVGEFHAETVYMMFLLLAEDVYLNLIRDSNLPIDSRRQLANSLLLLWEHRADQNISDISPVLQSVWKARARLAPAFGTMMGTSELIMISFQLDEQWSEFIKTKLADSDVSQAMEEFLFGLSFEQVTRLKTILREQGISAIGREEVSKYLGEDVPTNLSEDYRDFFQQYSVRRDNARARKRLGVSGPKKTIEDYFINFVMDRNTEKQKNDSVAK